MRFEIEDNSNGYLLLRDEILQYGRVRSPRGMKTWEIPHVQIKLHNPRLSHPVGIGRKYGPAIAAAEALGLIGGVQDPYLMVSAGHNFIRFLEDGGALHGAYGPRVRPQIPRAVDRLREDPDTRQAIVQVWDPLHDLAEFTPRDLPCTIGFQFALYDGRLEMRTKMRSNDFTWGWAHDAPMFTALQLTVAGALGVEVGPYIHEADSFHIYERDLELLSEMHEPDTQPPEEIGGGISCYAVVDGEGELDIRHGMERARGILANKVVPRDRAEEWYVEQISPHVERVKEARDRFREPWFNPPA